MVKPPVVLIGFIALAGAVFGRDLWLPALRPWLAPLGALAGGAARPVWLGYTEAETTFLGFPQLGRVSALAVAAGETVAAGDRLAMLDPTVIDDQIRRQQAAIAGAEARLANLKSGRRPEELAVTTAQRDEAAAQLQLAESDLLRQTDLLQRGVTSKTALDRAAATVAQLKARVAALDAQGSVGELTARPQEIAAAEADLAAQRALLDELRHRRDDLTITAPAAGRIDQIFFRAGETVPAGVPVLSLIAADAARLKVFVPEAEIAAVRPGQRLTFSCDGCGRRSATVLTLASRPEYTPPVIYSETARAKLSFRVDARPDQADLPRGLAVDVERIAPP